MRDESGPGSAPHDRSWYPAGCARRPVEASGGLSLAVGDADLAYGLAAVALAVGALLLTIRSRGLAATTRVTRKSGATAEPERCRR